jgi:hypothetical protein
MTIVGHALLLLVANLCLLGAGAGVTRALGVWSTARDLRRFVGTSYMAGVAAYGVAAQTLYVLGASLRLWQILALCLLLAATGAFSRAGGRPWSEASTITLRRPELIMAAVAILLLILLGIDSIFQPLASWDAWTQWTPKAQALVLDNGLHTHILGSEAFRDWHLDYPLFVPSIEAFGFRFIGIDVRVMHLQHWLLLAGFAAAFVEILRPRVRPLFVWTGLLALLAAPRLEGETIAANADVPLAVFLGLAGIVALIWITDSDVVALRLLALFAAASFAAKVEGTYLVVILFLATIAAVGRSRRRAVMTAAAGAVALLGIVPWRIWVAFHDIPATYSVREALQGPGWHDASRGPISTLVVLGQFFSPRAWLLLAPFSILAIAVLARSRAAARGETLVIAAGAAAAVGIAVTYAVPNASFPFPWRWYDSLVFVAVLVAVSFFAFVALKARSVATWALVAGGLMLLTFVIVYVVTPYPFAWHLGTSSARVVIAPELFLAAVIPLMLERAASRTRSVRRG